MPDATAVSTGIPSVATTPDAGGAAVETETPTTETPETETPAGGEEEPGGEPAEDDLSLEPADEEAELDEGLDLERDGRKVDAKTRDAIAKLAKTDKVAAKAVRDIYFRDQRIMQELGAKSTREALDAIQTQKAQIDALGGSEGITELQSKVEDYDREIRQFIDGDPELVSQLIEANPESVSKLARVALEQLAASDSKAFDEAFLEPFAARLEATGFPQTVDWLIEQAKAGKGQEVYDQLLKMQDFWKKLNGNRQQAARMRTQVNPEADRLARERAEVQRERQENFKNSVETDLNRLNNYNTKKVVEPFFREMKLSVEGRRRFVSQLNSDIYALMDKDEGFKRAYKGIAAKGNALDAARFAARKFSALLPEAFRKIRNESYPNYKPAKVTPISKPGAKPANGAAAPAAKAVPGKVYTRADVDLAATPNIFLITGKAYLKGSQTLVPYNRES